MKLPVNIFGTEYDVYETAMYFGFVLMAVGISQALNQKIRSVLTSFVNAFIFKVDETSKRHGGELVADVLKAHGIEHIFTLVGGHISPILVACEKIDINVVDTRHEVTAVFAADAVARLSGTVGVAVVTAGPGVTNTITAMKNAQMAESPLLLIGGAAATILKGRGALQDIDQMSLFKTICKHTATVTSVRDIVPTLKTALQQAQSNTPGPVFVEFPIDVLYPYEAVKRELFKTPKSKSIFSRIVQWYMNFYLRNIFAGAWDKQDMTPYKVDIPMPKARSVEKAASALIRAKRPVIVVGSQALLPPVSAERLRESLESLGVPCFLSGMARGLLGNKSGLQMRHQRGEALKEADLIILAGVVCDFRLQYGRSLNKKATIISVNRDASHLKKNSGIFWNVSIGVHGDPAAFLCELAEFLPNYSYDSSWLDKLQGRDQQKEVKNKKMSAEPCDNKYPNPMKILYELENLLPNNSILVADGGDFVATAAYILKPRGPLQWLDPGSFGTLGVGAGFAIGAKLCRPRSKVWIIYGDGSCGYGLSEFDTFERHKLPVIALVGNDACWTQIAREQVPTFHTSVACDLLYTNYHKVVEGFGSKGLLINENTANIREVLKEAMALNDEGKSVLINALIGTTKFREGSISV